MMDVAERYMHQALDLARRAEGRTRPNPAVGALVVRDGAVVGEGFHPEAGQAHAEIFALRDAGERARGADLYVTLEPCSHHGRTGPCAEAVAAAGVARVFVGTGDPNPKVAGRGLDLLRQAGIEVRCGILEAECRRLIAPFAKHVICGLPHVTLKSAVTLDGNTATASGDSQWITGPASREHVHRLRDRADAIMVGIGTVLHDDPALTTRLPEGGRDPLRVIVDSRLRLPEEARVLNRDSAAGTLVVCTEKAPADRIERLRELGAEVLSVPARGGQVDLGEMLVRLGERGIQSVFLEGGSILNAAMLQSGHVDRAMVFVAPLLLGGRAKGIFAGPGPERLAEALRLEDVRVSRCDSDILIEGEIVRCSPA